MMPYCCSLPTFELYFAKKAQGQVQKDVLALTSPSVAEAESSPATSTQPSPLPKRKLTKTFDVPMAEEAKRLVIGLPWARILLL